MTTKESMITKENVARPLLAPDLSRFTPLVMGETSGEKSAAVELKLAFVALGINLENEVRSQPDLVAATLAHIYALNVASPLPLRQDVRCKLIAKLFGTLGEPFASAVAKTKSPFKFDPLSRKLYLGLAGLAKGTVLEADFALLRNAFGISAQKELPQAIIRIATRQPAPNTVKRAEPAGVDQFARTIQKVARRLETKPYSGRVAIAQVYDAAVGEGLDFGSLDEFKDLLAEAAREGLLDLERYDIAGPFDANLKERSRLRLGRDERHFIVNQ